MTLSPKIVAALNERGDWFTLTRVTVRVSPHLGGYLLDVEGPVVETLETMREDKELGEILSVSGVAHPPQRTWRFAFRIDDSGPHVAANASPEALRQIAPQLTDVAGLG